MVETVFEVNILTLFTLIGVLTPIIIYLINERRGLINKLETIDRKQERNHDCISRLEKKIDEYKIEHEKAAAQKELQLQKQIDASKENVSKLLSKMETVSEKVNESEKIHKEIKQMIKDQMNFTIDWNQRIEDRIEDARLSMTTKHRKRRVATTADE
jgi:seryl-tRNA synthetase